MSTIAAGLTSTNALVSTGDTSGQLVFQTNGTTTAMTIDTSQNVGIGTSSPAVKLDIVGANNGDQIRFGNGRLYTFKTSNANTYDNSLLTLDSNSSVANYAWAISGSEKMRIDFNGNVGIGTSSPDSKLQVSSASLAAIKASITSSSGNVARFQLTGGTSNYAWYVTDNLNYIALYDYNANSERMRIDSSGKVGIGITSPVGRVDALAPSGGFATFAARSASTGTGQSVVVTSAVDNIYSVFADAVYQAIAHIWQVNGTEQMRLDSSGNFLLGASSQFAACRVGISAPANLYNIFTIKNTYTGNTGNFALFVNSSGSSAGLITQTGATTVAYATSSDYRLKENVAPMQNALGVVAQLKPVTYTWKADGSSGQGFIAHELQEVVPDCVTGEKDAVDDKGNPKYQGIDTSFLVATLTAAIQEQQAIINELKSRIETLENK